MKQQRLRRRASLVSIVAIFALAGAACTTGGGIPLPPQSQGNFQIKANTLTVIDHNNDGLFGAGEWDEPYLINLNFRVWFNHPGSAATFVVDDVSNELTCPGGPDGGLFGVNGNGSCSNGESSAVPAAMGLNQFPNLKSVDVADLVYGYQPEVAGTVSFAYEEDQLFGSGNVADTVADFADALTDILNSTIAVGVLPADGNAAAALLVDVIGDVFLGFIGNTLLGLLSGLGNADDLIGIAPIIGVGINGTLASLANAAGLSGTPVLGGAIYTFGGTPPGGVDLTYKGQAVGPITLGSTDTEYKVNWTVGPY
jgi:hypothetical protein